MIVAIDMQLSVKSYVEDFMWQYGELDRLKREKGIEADFEYCSFSRAVYDKTGRSGRLMINILTALFVIVSGLYVFPADKKSGMYRLLGSTRNSNKMIYARIVSVSFLTAVLSASMNYYRLKTVYSSYSTEETGILSTVIQSMERYRNCGLQIDIRTALVINILSCALVFALMTAFLMGVSLFFANPMMSQVTGVIVFGAIFFFGDFIEYGGTDFFRNPPGFVLLPVLIIMISAAVFRGRERWKE